MAATARAVAGLAAGRERQQSLGFANQHGPAARRADPTGAHAHPLSLPPSANHLPSTNTASSFFSEVAPPAPGANHASTLRSGYLYIRGAR